jgi:hypothetical protein
MLSAVKALLTFLAENPRKARILIVESAGLTDTSTLPAKNPVQRGEFRVVVFRVEEDS